ncbi:hypothetical protein D3C87_1269010 [compost metagenome]
MKSLVVVMLFFSSAAFALTETEQTLTPRAQQFELRAGAAYEFMDASYETGGSATSNGFIIPATAFYGLNDNNAIGFGINYLSQTIDEKPNLQPSYKSKTKGFENFNLQYKGNFDIIRKMTLFLGAEFDIPPEKFSINRLTYDYTASKGQMSLSGTVGLLMPVSMFKLGTLLSYKYAMDGDGTLTDVGYTNAAIKTSGGSGFAIQFFGEIENAYNPNVSIGYSSYDKISLKANGVSVGNFIKRDILALRGSLRFIATENLDIIPYASYENVLNKSDVDADKWNIFTLGADARFLF